MRRGQRSRGLRRAAHARPANADARPASQVGAASRPSRPSRPGWPLGSIRARTYRALISSVAAAVWLVTSGSYMSSATDGGCTNVPAEIARIMNS